MAGSPCCVEHEIYEPPSHILLIVFFISLTPYSYLMDDQAMSLSLLPNELITQIYQSLASTREVIALATTNHRIRNVWLQNANSIFDCDLFDDVWAGRQALNFLLTQSGKKDGDVISAEDVLQIVRNHSVVENAILLFEQEVVSHMLHRDRTS